MTEKCIPYLYQNVHFFIWNKTGVLNVSIFKYLQKNILLLILIIIIIILGLADDQSINQSIKIFLEWPNGTHYKCRDL